MWLCFLHTARVMHTLDSRVSHSVWTQKDMCFVKTLWHILACVQCFCATRSVLLCARSRPYAHVTQQQWCNNNDSAPRPSLWLCLWHGRVETNKVTGMQRCTEWFQLNCISISYTSYNIVTQSTIILFYMYVLYNLAVISFQLSVNAHYRK